MKHIIEAQQFDRDALEHIFTLARELKEQPKDYLKGKILASLFYEPSTRTRLSFESAMQRLGGNVIGTENAQGFSSAVKGETLEDTIRVIAHYADVIVLRYFESGAAERAAAVSPVPIINAGDGAGQHPTQALLDLYTILRELGKIDGIHIAMVGDTKHSRSVRSLAYMLGKFNDVTIHFVAPPELKIKDDILAYLDQHNVAHEETEDLNSLLPTIDVIYRNRIQKERFENQDECEKFKNIYLISADTVNAMKKGAIVMDPLPRVGGILPEVDILPQAVYFKQAHYGVVIRMALLKLLLNTAN